MSKPRINHQIKAETLRVVDEAGNNLGLLSLAEALTKAVELGQDLIEVAPKASPPVAKIMDFGKYQYLQNKKAKRLKTVRSETKTIQIKIGTGDHDLEIKANKVSGFLEEGHRVKIDLFLRGRARYLNNQFLQERLERLLKFIAIKYKVAEPPKKSPKGMSLVIERG